MTLTFYNIYNYFKYNSLLTNIVKSSPQIPLLETKLIVKNQNIFKNNIIYVGTTSFIIKNQIYLQDAHVILIDDSPESLPVDNLVNCTYFILKSTCDLFDIFNQINEIFTENSLLNALQNNTSLDNIAEISSHILDNPIIIIDGSYRILVSSDTSKISDKFWIENIKKGYCSYDFIAYVRNMESMKTSLNNTTPFPVICTESPIERWVTKFFVHGKLAGYIIVLLSNSPMEDSDKNILPIISDVVSKTVKKNFNKRNLDNFDYENFLMDLLDNHIKDSNTINEKFKSYNLTFKNNFIMIVLDINNFDSRNKIPNYLSYKLENLFHQKTYIYYENYIVVLYDYNKEPFISMDELQCIETFAHENRILLGISNSFKDLLNCRKYFHEAKISIEISKKMKIEKTINHYKSIQFYDFVNEAEKSIQIEDFIHPSLNIIKSYDKKNNTELYKTLYVYLKNNQNCVFTGKELFIHRNTVKYRLDKIFELTHIDLKNEDEAFNIFFSYKCLLNTSN